MSPTMPSVKPPTLADLDALPPGIVGEIIEGVLYTMMKPRMRHQRTTTTIGGQLQDPFDLGRGGPGGWWIVTEPGIELPNTPEISPDVAGWRRERMPELPYDEPIRVVPDWVCEILSKHALAEAEVARRAEEAALRLAAEAERSEWEALARAFEDDRKQAAAEQARLLEVVARDAARAPAEHEQQVVMQPAAGAQATELDEHEARALIDAQLRDAGWEADSQTLRGSADTPSPAPTTNGHRPDDPLDLVVAALQQGEPRRTAADIIDATNLDASAVKQTLKSLVAAGQVRLHGKARGAAHEWIA